MSCVQLDLASEVAVDISTAIEPMLTNLHLLDQMAEVTQEKGDGHTAHRIDGVAEAALLASLEKLGFAGTLFSEEAGLVHFGPGHQVIISDPYCNTTLTFRGIRESAITVYEHNLDGDFLAGAIIDLQQSALLWARVGHAATIHSLRQPQQPHRVARCSSVSSLDEAAIVIPLFKRSRREHHLLLPLFFRAAMLFGIDGGIVASRIATGSMDAFVDVHRGQPLYEALAYQLVRSVGGVVTDETGVDIDFGILVRRLLQGDSGRVRLVVAANRALHQEVLGHL